MKKQFVRTSNYERFQEGLTVLENRGAAEASMMLVTGEAGFGKSETVDQWAIQAGAAYLRAKEGWTPSWFKSELAENLKLDAHGRPKELFARIAGFIGARQIPLVIDEAEHCLKNNAEVLEAIRNAEDICYGWNGYNTWSHFHRRNDRIVLPCSHIHIYVPDVPDHIRNSTQRIGR